jgi:hypothetical protein
MKLSFIKLSIFLSTLVLWPGMSVGDVINIGTFSGNDNDATYVSSLVGDYNTANNTQLPQPLTLLGKWEVDEGVWNDDENPGFTGSFFEGGQTGTWFTPNDWETSDPLYYSFKAANDFALYYANGETSGNWEIDWTAGNGGQIPELSHISFWTAKADSTNPVPEPGTLALVGLGLATIAGYRRKRHAG